MSWKSLLKKIIKKEDIYVVATHVKRHHISTESIENWLRLAIEWMARKGVRPTKFSTFGVDGYKEAKVYSFDSRLGKHISTLDTDSIESIKIYSDEKKIVSSGICNAQSEHSSSYATWAWQSDVDMVYEDVVDLFGLADNLNLLGYGFVYPSSDENFYATEGQLSAFQREQGIQKGAYRVWADGAQARRAFESGRHPIEFLREIYKIQILMQEHLDLKVGSVTLKEWIESDVSHGELALFEKHHWMWNLSNSDMGLVRDELMAHNLLAAHIADKGKILESYGEDI